LFKLLQKM